MNKLYAWFRICRPPIVFIAVFGSLVTALVFQGTKGAMDMGIAAHKWSLAFALFCWGIIWAGIMIHNDFTDLESDKHNRPNKPIPSGAISPKTAHISGLVMMAVGCLAPVPILYHFVGVDFAISCMFWGCTLWFVGLYYDYWGKNHAVVGNASVAWGVALIPLYGGALVSPYYGLILLFPLFVGIFVSEIGREILVCAGDYYGDLKQGWRTVPVIHGRMESMRQIPFWFFWFIPFYAIPYFGWFGFPAYFSPIYFWGFTFFIVGLYFCWFKIYRTMKRTNDEKKIWASFEYWARTWTRLLIIIAQFIMLAEAYWGSGLY